MHEYSVIFIAGESLARTLLFIIPPSRMSHGCAFLLYGVSFLKSRTRYVTLAPSPPFSVHFFPYRKYDEIVLHRVVCKVGLDIFLTVTISILFISTLSFIRTNPLIEFMFFKIIIFIEYTYVLKNYHRLEDSKSLHVSRRVIFALNLKFCR